MPEGAGFPTAADEGHAVSLAALERFLPIKGDGDEWDFKQTLSLDGLARVELARDAMAMGNHRGGGWLILGVTDGYEYPGLSSEIAIDTTKISNAVQTYIDGDFTMVAAEHTWRLRAARPRSASASSTSGVAAASP